jgi:hypothetical protein
MYIWIWETPEGWDFGMRGIWVRGGNGEISLRATWERGGQDPITARRVPSKKRETKRD